MNDAPRRVSRFRNLKLGVLAALLAVAAATIWHEEQPARLLPSFASRSGAAADSAIKKLLAEPDPALHLEYLEALRNVRYQGSMRNLFEPAPLAPPRTAGMAGDPGGARRGSAAAVAAGPPPPPPIPLKFYGYATNAQGGGKRVFLQMGDDIFVVSEGQLVVHRYRIVRIDKASVAVEDITEQRTEVLPLIVS